MHTPLPASTQLPRSYLKEVPAVGPERGGIQAHDGGTGGAVKA